MPTTEPKPDKERRETKILTIHIEETTLPAYPAGTPADHASSLREEYQSVTVFGSVPPVTRFKEQLEAAIQKLIADHPTTPDMSVVHTPPKIVAERRRRGRACPKCGPIMQRTELEEGDTLVVTETCPNCGATDTYREPAPP
jgi:ribosomal protein S27AE